MFSPVLLPPDEASNLLGELNRGVYVLMSGLDVERLVLAAGPVGLMQAACDVVFAYAQERRTFGRAISDHGMVQAKLADIYTRLQASRAFLYTVARRLDSFTSTSEYPSMCHMTNGKASQVSMNCASVILHNAEAATEVALDAIQILGTSFILYRIPKMRRIIEIQPVQYLLVLASNFSLITESMHGWRVHL